MKMTIVAFVRNGIKNKSGKLNSTKMNQIHSK